MSGIALNLNRYGAVTLPDLPGLGGMDSFYKIGLKPTIDNYADYLASFIKLRFRKKRLTIMAMSFSFSIVTKMLQKNPELASKVDFLVSIVGFVHHDDFRLPPWQQNGLKMLGRVCELRVMAFLFRYIALNRFVIRLSYSILRSNHSKLHDANDAEFNARVNAEIKLWHLNDVRTRSRTLADMFAVNVCDKKVSLKAYHVSVPSDRYFDNHIVEQHMKVIFNDFTNFQSNISAHVPSIVATAEEADPFIPEGLKHLLNQ